MSASTSKWTNDFGVVAVADRDDAGGYDLGPSPGPANIMRKIRHIDCTVTNLSSAVQTRAMVVGAGTLVTRVELIPTAVDGSLTAGVGDATSGTTFLTTAALSVGGGAVTTTGKYYSSADEINITASADASNFKGFLVVDYSHVSTTGN